MHLLVNVSRLLKDMQLGVEVLSLFESAPTKVKGLPRKEGKSMFSSSSKIKVRKRELFMEMITYLFCQLVEEQFVITGLPKEQSWELLGNHAELCGLQQLDGKPDTRLKKWIQSVLTKDFLTDTLQRIESGKGSSQSTMIWNRQSSR
jgi:hypothetical protein